MTPSAPDTPATRAATELALDHEVVVIERAGSVEEAAERIGVPTDRLIKTLVVRRSADDHVLVLVPGSRQLDWPSLRSHLGVSRLSLPDAAAARDATGYERGTITPLGAEGGWPVLADASLVGTGRIAIGGGAHGVSLLLDADDLLGALDADTAEVTRPG